MQFQLKMQQSPYFSHKNDKFQYIIEKRLFLLFGQLSMLAFFCQETFMEYLVGVSTELGAEIKRVVRHDAFLELTWYQWVRQMGNRKSSTTSQVHGCDKQSVRGTHAGHLAASYRMHTDSMWQHCLLILAKFLLLDKTFWNRKMHFPSSQNLPVYLLNYSVICGYSAGNPNKIHYLKNSLLGLQYIQVCFQML